MTFKERLVKIKAGLTAAAKAFKKFMTTQDELDRRLQDAVTANDLAQAEKAILKGANVNKTRWTEEGPLPDAVKAGQSDMVALLLKHKADPNNKYGYSNNTPFWMAVREGDMGIITQLLEAGGDVNTRGDKDKSVYTHAVATKNKQLAEMLRAGGAKTDSKDKFGWTPLFYAARNGDTETVATLLANGSRTYLKDCDGRSVLRIAEEAEQFAARDMIQSHIDAQVPAWQKVSDQEIAHVSIFRQQGYRLTETFNMETKTCAVIAHNFATGKDAVVVQSFDELKNPLLVKTATEKLAGLTPAAEQQNTPAKPTAAPAAAKPAK